MGMERRSLTETIDKVNARTIDQLGRISAMVNRNRIIDRFVEMVEIDNIRPGRQFKEYKRIAAPKGLIVTEDRAGESLGGNAGNLLAVWPGSAGTKLLFVPIWMRWNQEPG